MTIENQNEAGVPAPESTSTAAVETVETQAPEETEPKTFTQEELDRIVAKEKAQAERKVRREMAQAAQQPQNQVPTEAPRPDQFKSPEEYAEAKAEYLANQKLAEREAEKQRTKVESEFEDRLEEARAKYDDYDDVVYAHPKDGGPAISEYMAEAIRESDLGPEIAYHLGKNPKESLRIYGLSPLAQAREIGKIEASLSSAPAVVKKPSSAPEPIKPVGARSATPKYDPSDPRSSNTMSDSEWINARNEQIAKQSR
jgi:hypothetical protein